MFRRSERIEGTVHMLRVEALGVWWCSERFDSGGKEA